MPQSNAFRAGTAATAAALVVSLLAGCVATPPREAAQQAAGDASAVIMVAEVALERGQCRAASEGYARASGLSADASIAARATQVAIGCEQLELAQRSAQRWQLLAPQAGEPALARSLVAMKLYQIDEARKALALWRDSGAAGGQDPGRFADLLENESEATAAARVFGNVLLNDDSTADVLVAQATLALHAFDLAQATSLAQRALVQEAGLLPARLLLVRAQALRGEHDAALTAARELQGKLSGEDAFLVVDVLTAAQRTTQAREELLRLRQDAQLTAAVDRRLGAMAMEQGDRAEAELRFTSLLGQRGSTTVAMIYLAQLAERHGDDDRALRAYALLSDSTVSLMAHGGAARILLRQGKRPQALALFDDYQRAHPESAIEVIAARAQLLAGHDEYAPAVAAIDAGLLLYPAHPTLQYQRATMLERAGRHREAEAAFEALLRKRPEDPGITNALGFTLADHGRSLDRAEKLIRHALTVSPDNPAIQDSLGWLHYRKGRTVDAVQVLELAWRNGHDPDIAAHFGEALWKHGEEGRARYVWQQALNLDPDSQLVRATQSRLTGEEAPSGRR